MALRTSNQNQGGRAKEEANNTDPLMTDGIPKIVFDCGKSPGPSRHVTLDAGILHTNASSFQALLTRHKHGPDERYPGLFLDLGAVLSGASPHPGYFVGISRHKTHKLPNPMVKCTPQYRLYGYGRVRVKQPNPFRFVYSSGDTFWLPPNIIVLLSGSS